ncbi:MAG TPA: endonuclease/exonuclease/phosphatase family protein [Natronosporangium sp.]
MILRFATFNIRNGRGLDGRHSWPVRRRFTAAAIAALRADVLGLQEVFEYQRRYLARRLPGLRWFGEDRDGTGAGEQCPVAVTDPSFEVVSARTRWYGAEPDRRGCRLPGASFPRIATLVRLRTAGVEFEVANTHLDERSAANRAESVKQLVSWLDPAVPTVVIGDFNTVPSDTAVLGPLTDAGFLLAPVAGGTSHGFTGAVDGPQIDHAFISPHWTMEEAFVARDYTGWRLPSDHWPVRVTVRLRSAEQL